MIASFVRGLSVRDVEATLAEALGDQAAISKSTVSRGVQGHQGRLTTPGQRRRLDEVGLDYLFLDASFSGCTPARRAEPVLAAWGITTDGKPVFVGLAAASGESTDAWADFLDRSCDRGLPRPAAGHLRRRQGLIAAIEQDLLPVAAAKMPDPPQRNVLAKIPAHAQEEIRDGTGPSSTPTTRARSPSERFDRNRIDAFARRYRATYPAAMKILLTDRQAADRLPALPG